MTDIIVSISLYLVAAIVLGFIFGWFIAKSMLKEKYDEQLEILSVNDIEKVKEELIATQASNRELLASKNVLSLKYEARCATLEKEKHQPIDNLTSLHQLEEKYMALKVEHEKEIEAFLDERVEITQKYKALLEQVEEASSIQKIPEKKSWFGKNS